ncbi:MAG: arginine--tRNA ligase [Candidatus Paceibacterota bacterium]|jgi:arginyl-tRNA synthetase
MVIQDLKLLIQKALKNLSLEAGDFTIEHPADMSRGDFATSVALSLAKQAKVNPRELADRIATELNLAKPSYIEKMEVAGAGFINITLSRTFFAHEMEVILKRGKLYGSSNEWRGTKALVEYTDPNPLKVFHIGHLMSNAIGESIARLIASQGAKVRRMCYQGDVGLHIAKTLWGIMRREGEFPSRRVPIADRVAFLGACYVQGSNAYEDSPEAKTEIEAINKKIYEGSDRKLMKYYKLGRTWSLDHLEGIYKKLGTRFDYYVLESEIMHDGVAIVNEYLEKGIFEKSDGAVVFRGEAHDPKLHTRVFINSQGLPTYEAKELGLNTRKWKRVRPDRSIIITANEQSDYFRVVLKAFELILPEARKVTEHVSHGMMRFADGKMGSRKGNIITGESMIEDVEKMVFEKLVGRDMPEKDKAGVAEIVAVSAIKYSILKQTTSSDIIYDFDKSISFEGDSGPYLLYTAVRAGAILAKADKEKIKGKIAPDAEPDAISRTLARFPEVVSRAANEKAPHYVATYLTELSSLFNSWYANTTIVSKDDPLSPHRVALTRAVRIVLVNGLDLLGIKAPERM